jgi:hypothetical protein
MKQIATGDFNYRVDNIINLVDGELYETVIGAVNVNVYP